MKKAVIKYNNINILLPAKTSKKFLGITRQKDEKNGRTNIFYFFLIQKSSYVKKIVYF